MDLLNSFQQYIKSENLFQPGQRLLVAVSGGVDSVVLLSLLIKAGYNVGIAHCNFHLREAASDRDELFVKKLAADYALPFYLQSFDTITEAKASKKSIEETARNLRYNWFEEVRASEGFEFILTAHHADDNIETVMMNFFRGTGISGLRGIMPKQGKVVRPLLFARRAELELYVNTNALPFVTDHTNAEDDYTRNYFRNKIIPLVRERFPEADNNVLKNIKRFGETGLLYQQALQLHLKKLLEVKGNEVHIPVLKLLKSAPLQTITYEILKPYNFTAHQTTDATALLKAESGKFIESSTHRLIKNRNWLIISPKQTSVAANIVIEEKDVEVSYPNGQIKLSSLDSSAVKITDDKSVALLDAGAVKFPLLLRKWKTGDYFYPLGMQKKKKLSRFFIDNKMPISQKENTWVIEMDKKICWIVGMRIDDRFKITPNTKKVLKLSAGNVENPV